ncbi:CHY zinc finger protein [Corynebacterium kalinowskii]|uniref:CHY zinc finger protein n=1 Tax=Corynebacterium kalinowskii TaxID=2675216 RepID=UPI0012E282C3|nr:CHY zinc finger protein [Corynebacterium kalinowskii]
MIRGRTVDKHGRCEHYHSELDVVANKCATCGEYWACYQCHQESGHAFGAMPRDEKAVMCGVCGHEMTAAEYADSCPKCGAQFNPGCKLHAGIYFAD